jgi:hypothetical protein
LGLGGLRATPFPAQPHFLPRGSSPRQKELQVTLRLIEWRHENQITDAPHSSSWSAVGTYLSLFQGVAMR